MPKRPKILVVGSFVMDLIVSTAVFPNSGETVLGTSYESAPGGKGANQAIQSALLGADVTMVGKVGDDAFGKALVKSASDAGVHTEHVSVDPLISSGIGNVLLETTEGLTSKNRIIVIPGANMSIVQEDISFLAKEISGYDLLLLQLEIPMEINESLAQYAFDAGVPVMLNCAPSAPLSSRLLSCLTYLSPNEHEATALTGVQIARNGKKVCLEDVQSAAVSLNAQGIKHVLITLGSSGAAIVDAHGLYFSPSVDLVEVRDPTAAGDSFIGAFCTAVCWGLNHSQAMEFANFTAALTVSKMGAQPSLPTLREVIDLISKAHSSQLRPELFIEWERGIAI